MREINEAEPPETVKAIFSAVAELAELERQQAAESAAAPLG
jgi:hypothetical protein